MCDDAQLGTGALAALRDPMLERAALLSRAALEVRLSLCQKSVAPPQGKSGKYRCSTGFGMIFNSCRIPMVGADVAYIYNSASGTKNNHIVVFRRGHAFRIDITVESKLLSRCTFI